MQSSTLFRKTFVYFLLTLLTCFLMSGVLSAQERLVVVNGVVTDVDGNALPGAAVNLKDIRTGYAYSATTNKEGQFNLLGVEAGQYEVQASLSGFKTEVRSGMTFSVGARITQNFTLAMSSLEETVNVTAQAPLVEVTKSSVSSVVGRREIDDLPVVTRTFTQLAMLQPGTSGSATDIRGSGGTSGSGNILIDGVSDKFSWYNTMRSDIPADAIEEFRVLVNQYGAEYGDAAGVVVHAITKSGTNQLRGRAYGFWRDESFDSPNYFLNHTGYQGDKLDKGDYSKAEFSQYRFGGNVGGPIKKDKLHFFLSYEGSRYTTYSVITSPLVTKEAIPVKNINDQLLAKLNYQLNEKNMLSFRFIRDNPRGQNLGVGGYNTRDVSYDQKLYDNMFQGSWTFYPTNNSMNELRVQYSDRYQESFGNEMSASPDSYQINRPSGTFGKYWSNPSTWPETRYQANDNFNLYIKNHSLKVGFDYNYVDSKTTSYWGWPGIYTFDTDKPFNASDPTTYPTLFRVNRAAPSEEWARMTSLAFFVQDTWQVLPRLTLNIGVRYSSYSWKKNPNQEKFWISNKYNWDPRISFSWDPFGDGKTSIRGGAGKYTTNPMGNAIYYSVVNRVEYDLVYYNFPGYPDPSVPNPFIEGGQADILKSWNDFVRGMGAPYNLQYTLGIERQIMSDLSVSADLVMAEGKHLFWFYNANPIIPGTKTKRADPTSGDILIVDDGGSNRYKGLYLTARKRYAHGWSLDVTYTLSKGEGNCEAGDANSPSNNESRAFDWGPLNTDARHRLNISAIADLPLGFQLSSIFMYQSALPYNITYGYDYNMDGTNRDFYPYGAHRNNGRGFEYLSWDARVSKFVNLGSRFSVQIFAEAFNLTNRVNFGAPQGSMRSKVFGKPSSAQSPRQVQLGLRLNF
ncbi:MAG: TonB-dependent receptor [Candidatus Aminicenantales bacterium]